jgi:hypothetical protein
LQCVVVCVVGSFGFQFVEVSGWFLGVCLPFEGLLRNLAFVLRRIVGKWIRGSVIVVQSAAYLA